MPESSSWMPYDSQGVKGFNDGDDDYDDDVCDCSFSYPACNAHVPYCQLWPA